MNKGKRGIEPSHLTKLLILSLAAEAVIVFSPLLIVKVTGTRIAGSASFVTGFLFLLALGLLSRTHNAILLGLRKAELSKADTLLSSMTTSLTITAYFLVAISTPLLFMRSEHPHLPLLVLAGMSTYTGVKMILNLLSSKRLGSQRPR